MNWWIKYVVHNCLAHPLLVIGEVAKRFKFNRVKYVIDSFHDATIPDHDTMNLVRQLRQDRLHHDSIDDEKKLYTLDEFITVAKSELETYNDEWHGANDFHKKPHTWSEWMNSFIGWMSW